MTQPYFDTLKYAKLLLEYGFTQIQTQGLMSAQIHVLQSTLDNIVTHTDLQRSEFALRADLLNLESKLSANLVNTEHRLENKIKDFKQDLELKIAQVDSNLKVFVLKNTVTIILAMLGMQIALGALLMELLKGSLQQMLT